MTREEAIRIFRKEVECLSHTKCSDCRLKGVCDPISTTPSDSEYIEVFGMAIETMLKLDKIERFIIYRDSLSDHELLETIRAIIETGGEQ